MVRFDEEGLDILQIYPSEETTNFEKKNVFKDKAFIFFHPPLDLDLNTSVDLFVCMRKGKFDASFKLIEFFSLDPSPIEGESATESEAFENYLFFHFSFYKSPTIKNEKQSQQIESETIDSNPPILIFETQTNTIYSVNGIVFQNDFLNVPSDQFTY
jgi:hypothetical protein